MWLYRGVAKRGSWDPQFNPTKIRIKRVHTTHALRIRLIAVVYWGGGYTRVYAVYQPPGFYEQRILTSVIINKQGMFRPFAYTHLYFLAIHHWLIESMNVVNELRIT